MNNKMLNLERAKRKFEQGLNHAAVAIDRNGELTTHDLCRLGIKLISELEESYDAGYEDGCKGRLRRTDYFLRR